MLKSYSLQQHPTEDFGEVFGINKGTAVVRFFSWDVTSSGPSFKQIGLLPGKAGHHILGAELGYLQGSTRPTRPARQRRRARRFCRGAVRSARTLSGMLDHPAAEPREADLPGDLLGPILRSQHLVLTSSLSISNYLKMMLVE